jgi:hypothetical protein
MAVESQSVEVLSIDGPGDVHSSKKAKPRTSPVPSLKPEEVGCDLDSDTAGYQQFNKEYDLAKEALNRADANELFILYENCIRERNKLMRAYLILATTLSGHGDKPNLHAYNSEASPNVVDAMERVSLAAIKLAQSVLETKKDEKAL